MPLSILMDGFGFFVSGISGSGAKKQRENCRPYGRQFFFAESTQAFAGASLSAAPFGICQTTALFGCANYNFLLFGESYCSKYTQVI